jgi:uncharacterized membrane protein (GlpM family)
MDLLLKALVGALMVVVIQLVARSRRFYLAGLVPLFPTFTLISHVIVGTQRPASELRATVRFGIVAMIPYLAYMITLYLIVERVSLLVALLSATLAWLVTAAILVRVWPG